MKAEEREEPPPLSPCIRVCRLDDAGLCIGCRRTMEEITGWWSMSDHGQRAVLRDLSRRPAAGDPRCP